MQAQTTTSLAARIAVPMACCWLLAMSTSALALSWEQAAAPDGDPVFTLRHAWVFDPAPANRNGKGDAGERVFPRLRLLYDGSAAAQNVTATFATGDPDITVVDGEASYASWPAGQGRNMGFKIRIDPGATTHTAEATVTVAADSPSGGPWTYDVAIEIVGGSPVFVRRSDWVFDPPPGNRDQKADGGERVFPRLRLINRGSVDAETVVATFTTDDPDITVVDGEKTYASWPRGQARNVGFKIDIAKTATTHTANATVTVSAGNPGSGPWVYDVAIDIVRGSPAFVPRNHWVFDPLPANRDGVANAGERVFPRIRLVNNGSVAAESVVAIFTTDDPDIIIADGDATYVSWPVRRARTVGFKINIVPSAATHTAQGTVTVTAGNPGSGPWTANVTIDIVGGQAVSFAQRSSWVRDAATGDGDRLAEPGERVEIRSRLLHDGFTDGENVVVTLGSSDENVTVVSGTLPQGAWPAGEARNNVGLVVDLGSGVGSAVQFVMDVTADNGGPWRFFLTIPVTLPAAPAALAAPEDIDRDGVVGIRDILTVATVYGQRASALPAGDLNGDGVLGIADMAVIEVARGDVSVAGPSARGSGAALVERWLREGSRLDDGTPVFRRGIAALEGILAALRPGATVLLPNYPNPFNPETWIPFDLSEAADVTVRVYDMQGRAVRRIALGHLDVGTYRGRSDAAYWDGRNELGESVASGVYIYELRAGTVVERRSMVIRK